MFLGCRLFLLTLSLLSLLIVGTHLLALSIATELLLVRTLIFHGSNCSSNDSNSGAQGMCSSR